MIIEDDEITSFLVEAKLRPLNLFKKFIRAFDGENAKWIYRSEASVKPKVAILDLDMPGMSGWEFLDWYEENQLQGTTKFAVCSSSRKAIDREKVSKYCDVVDFIEKPFTANRIEKLIDSLEY